MALSIQENIDLQPYNTFHVKARARYFVRIQSMSDMKLLLNEPVFKNNKRLILGGGSNCVFVNDFDGLIVRVETRGIEILRQSESEIHVKVASGEVWHDFVMHCLSNNWGGVENLSLIPGTVGAAPIQNIGAYGVEVKELIEHVDGISFEDGVERSFTNEECNFSYRESIFKHALSKNFFISSITLRLTTKNHRINTSYGGLNDYLNKQNIASPTIHDVSRGVIAIRRSKLPDPALIGNAGSFFKNPVISFEALRKLQEKYPEIPSYYTDNQLFKVPAGWLIEKAGWKGKRFHDVGVHEHQALVIVNHLHARGEEIFSLSQQIIDDVNKKFNVQLTREVNIIT